MFNKIKNIIKLKLINRKINIEKKLEEALIVKNIKKDLFLPLTKKEKQSINNLWKDILTINSFKEFEIYKKFNGFNSNYISHYIYLPEISRRLNNYKFTKIFEYKGLLGHLVNSKLKFPYCFIRYIDNNFYDSNMQCISFDQVINICLQINSDFIIKDSLDTSGGISIEKIDLNSIKKEQKLNFIQEKIKSRMKKDFVIQEYIIQHQDLMKFNPSSVNTIRINTLYLNGIVSVCSIILRIGKKGSLVDNICYGGISVGINSDGKLKSIGIDNKFNIYNEYNGINFEQESIPKIPEITKILLKEHKENFFACKFIGWDICIDNTGSFIVIELNSSQPEISRFQILNGPIFGDRTQEVINYCKQKKLDYTL